MTKNLSTGIDVLDRQLDGGLPPGRLLALSASAFSQSELFLSEMAAVRPTLYLTTERREPAVRQALDAAGTDTSTVSIHRVTPNDPFADAHEKIDTIDASSTVIIDPIRLFEDTNPQAYRTFMNDLKDTVDTTGSLAVLHCLEGQGVPEQRDRTAYLADIIFDLRTEFRSGHVENRLSIPKFRGGKALKKAVDLDLTTSVTVDVSRKIA